VVIVVRWSSSLGGHHWVLTCSDLCLGESGIVNREGRKSSERRKPGQIVYNVQQQKLDIRTYDGSTEHDILSVFFARGWYI
jgi:hypothetical protein